MYATGFHFSPDPGYTRHFDTTLGLPNIPGARVPRTRNLAGGQRLGLDLATFDKRYTQTSVRAGVRPGYGTDLAGSDSGRTGAGVQFSGL